LAGWVLASAGGQHLAEDNFVNFGWLAMAATIATLPSSWAGKLAKAPENEPTGVRAALAITIVVASVLMKLSFG
jgi:hypothetical protein